MTMKHPYKCEGPWNVARPGRLAFEGNETAVLFSRECEDSLRSELKHCFQYDGDDAGFAVVALPGRPWDKSMFSRDLGVLLRELTLWGYTEHAAMLAGILLEVAGKNEAGFFSYPDNSVRGEHKGGVEIDGICAVAIGMLLLSRHLPETHGLRTEIHDFLCGAASPLRFLVHTLDTHPLIPGSGEFGGGMSEPGDSVFYNCVQNHLAFLALTMGARFCHTVGEVDAAASFEGAAARLHTNLLRYLVDPDGAWYWCVSATSCQPVTRVLNSAENKGFSGVNGVLAMAADVMGFELPPDDPVAKVGRTTIRKLLEFPLRREQYDKYNIWTQFDILKFGLITGPSYSQGYTTQAALMLDDMDMATRLTEYLAWGTFRPLPGYTITRESPYWFYERMFSPDYAGKEPWDEGCGALNTVVVAEPLKMARMFLGLDNASMDTVKLVPRLPNGWQTCRATDWPILADRPLRADIAIERVGDQLHVQLRAEGPIRRLEIVNPKTRERRVLEKVSSVDLVL